ncbi:MAG: selenium cofactor biosynthesis protein YqeC [Sphaerochaeta sp.]
MATLIAALQNQFSGNENCICITGSGGKTTAMILLAEAYARANKRVLLSTTTKVLYPEDRDYHCDQYFWDTSIFNYDCRQGERVFYARRGSIKGEAPPLEDLERLKKQYDVVLLEADGARGMDLKLHSERDPVVPDFTTATLAIVSLSPLGNRLKDHCYGCDTLDDIIIDEQTYGLLLTHPEGIQKRMKGVRVILFNQAEKTDPAVVVALKRQFPTHNLFFGSLEYNIII